jgi:hypothetical protein
MATRIVGLVLMSFTAVTAIVSGIALIFYPDGRIFQMSVNLLEHSPFDNFMIPGLVLCLIVGGSNLIGALSLATDRKWMGQATLLAGISICGWIVVQYILIRTFNWLQVFYFLSGVYLLLISSASSQHSGQVKVG